jgi:hypothetical protein
MWLLRTFVLLLILAAGLLLGLFVLFVASQLNVVADAGQPVPSSTKLADLMATGPGDNGHIHLSEFRFGKPIVEKDGERWRCVWLPLQPTGKVPAKARPAVLRLGDSPEQQQLDELLTRKTVTALVGSAERKSAWDLPPDETFRKAHPEVDPERVTLLFLNPNIEFAGVIWLTEDMIFDRANARKAQGLGWGLIALAAISGLLLVREAGRRTVEGPRPTPPANEPELRRQLLDEQPLSVHSFQLLGAIGESLACLFCAVVSLGATFFCLALSGTPGGQVALKVLAVLFALLMFAGVFFFLYLAVRPFIGGALRIAIFPSGLRWWTLLGPRAALWSDIAQVYRASSIRSGVRMDSLDIRLYSGRGLHFTHRTLSDYEAFAQTVFGQWSNPQASALLARAARPSSRGMGKSNIEEGDWK